MLYFIPISWNTVVSFCSLLVMRKALLKANLFLNLNWTFKSTVFLIKDMEH